MILDTSALHSSRLQMIHSTMGAPVARGARLTRYIVQTRKILLYMTADMADNSYLSSVVCLLVQ